MLRKRHPPIAAAVWRRHALGLLAALAGASAAHAGATVTPMTDTSAVSAEALVNLLLAPSPGLTVVPGTANYIGAASASGTFTGGGLGADGLGIDSGVVLTTGDARFIGSSAAFPFDDANKTGTFTAGVGNALTPNTSPGYAMLSALAGAPTQNASVLSFAFVPQQSYLTLSLVFGSEDYNDLVNLTSFPNDVVGVFVNGTNQALVPGTSLNITASTINCGGPSSGASTGVGSQNCALYRDNAPFSNAIDSEVDGFTVKLTFTMPVVAGQVNTLAIGVADALDTVGDSAVLLGAGSITSAVPEPSAWALMLAGLAASAGIARRRKLG